MAKANLTINIRGRDEVVYAGEAESVSAKNDTGPFDILPGHANFITLVSGNIEMQTTAGKKGYKVENALMRVVNNKVDVFIGISA